MVAMGPEPGPGVITPSLDEVLSAMSAVDPEFRWADVRERILPVLPRLRPYVLPQDDPIRLMLPPGILVGFGIDIGPAFVHVTEPLRETWGVDASQVAAVALDNVRRRADVSTERVVRETIADVPIEAFKSGDGWAAALLLVPDRLQAVFGTEPRLFVAPMRDLLMAMPPDVEPAFASFVSDDFAAADPNGLRLGGFRYDGAGVSPVELDRAVSV